MIQFIKASVRGLVYRTVASFAAAASTFIRGTSHYDAAEDGDENRKHWGRARERSAQLANTPPVRRKVRVRCRYEADNNCYLSGLVSTLATDVIGYTAPKLQVLTDNAELNTFIESLWLKWSESLSVNLSSKLRVLDETRRIEGEGFLMMVPDEQCEIETGFNLNIVNLSPSRITDPQNYYQSANYIENVFVDGVQVSQRRMVNDDGVIVDGVTGRPVRYKVTELVEDYGNSGVPTKEVSARYMLQWFCPRRPGQFRGMCELAPALPLYAQLRRYGLATLTAAEIAAMFAGIMTTQVPPGEDPPVIEPGLKIELERGMLVAMPEGSQATQFKPEQPVSSYEMFVNMILREVGRTLDVPFGIVAGDSSKYNYSSAQLDYRGYEERMNFDKKQLIIRILNPLFQEWLRELSTRDSRVRKALDSIIGIYHTWHFARRPSSDPEKDANAEDTRLRNGTTTYAEIFAARGMDYEEQWDQLEKEKKILTNKKLIFEGISDIIDVSNQQTNVDKIKPADTATNGGTDTTNNKSIKDAAATADVQQSSLNGAQMTSLVLVADKIAIGAYTIEAGILLLQVSFPLADAELLRKLVNELAKSKGSVVSEPVTSTNAA